MLQEICRRARRVVILDHHASAWCDLDGLDREHANLELVFDMTRSGAVITWEYFHFDPVPELLAHVQDRDLWTFRLPQSADVTAALMSYPLEFARWRDYAASRTMRQQLALEGEAINRYRRQEIAQHRELAVMGRIAGFTVPVVNAPVTILSELLSELATGYPFAAGYRDEGTRRTWSLRSTEQGEDVSCIAVRFGGGGHPRAAGFSTPLPPDLLTIDV